MTTDIHIKQIVLEKHFHHCQRLRSISYEASYGSLSGFTEQYGEGYRDRLKLKINQVPAGVAHVWHGDKIIGQTEAKLITDPGVGYINLLVLMPDYQRQGIG